MSINSKACAKKREKIDDDMGDEDLPCLNRKKRKKTINRKQHAGGDSAASHCVICLELLNCSGAHKICCLKCGHIFGRRCITKSITKNGLCPICKCAATVSQIRDLHNIGIAVRDIGDRDAWMSRCQSLMDRVNQEVCHVQTLQAKNRKLDHQNQELMRTIQALKCELIVLRQRQNDANHHQDTDTHSYLDHFKFPMDKQPQRSSGNQLQHDAEDDGDDDDEQIPIAQRIGVPLRTELLHKIPCYKANTFQFSCEGDRIFYGHCNGAHYHIHTASLLDLNASIGVIRDCHLQQINDICVRTATNNTELLSVSSDRTIAVSDVREQRKKYYLQLPSIGNSCAWSNKYWYQIYAACNNGLVCIYDIRMNHKSIGCRKLGPNNSNVHSLHWLPAHNDEMLIASNKHCYAMTEGQLMDGHTPLHPMVISMDDCNGDDDEIYACCYDARCDSMLLSYQRHHTVMDLNTKRQVIVNYEGLPPPMATKTALFCTQANKYICFQDRTSKLYVCSSNYNHNDRFRFKQMVHDFDKSRCYDIKVHNSRETRVIGALCDKYIVFYRVSPDQ